jgi:hypothetical protein
VASFGYRSTRSIVLCLRIRLAYAIHLDLKPVELSLEPLDTNIECRASWLRSAFAYAKPAPVRAVRSGFFHHINALAPVGRRSFKHRPAVLIFSEKQKQNGI